MFGFKKVTYYNYDDEEALKNDVLKENSSIFGNEAIYIENKWVNTKDTKMGNETESPIGFILDFRNEKLWIVEYDLTNKKDNHVLSQAINVDKILRSPNTINEIENGIYKEVLEKVKEDPELMKMIKNVLGEKMNLRDELAQIIKYNEIGFILIIDKMSDEFKEIEYYISKIMNRVILIVFQTYEEKGEEKRKYTPLTDLNKLSQHNNSTITKSLSSELLQKINLECPNIMLTRNSISGELYHFYIDEPAISKNKFLTLIKRQTIITAVIKKEKVKRETLGSSKHGLRSYFGRNEDEGTFFINSQEKRFRIDNIRDSIRQIKQSYEITKNETVKKNEEEQ